ncbi:MAG: YbjN domain-containing protein [Desulfovibrionaceae bacterium]|nr:YbjN domain-containing protein [Desulfovibrionaceae bacterium]
MATASQILGWIQRILEQQDLRYELVEDKQLIKSQFPLDCKLKNFTAFFNCRDDSYTVNSYIALGADEGCRLKVAEYITRANYGLKFGNFEMDFNDGEIRYRMTVSCEDRTDLSESLVMGSIIIPMRMYERYGDGLIAVMYGIKSPEDAINEAEK